MDTDGRGIGHPHRAHHPAFGGRWSRRAMDGSPLTYADLNPILTAVNDARDEMFPHDRDALRIYTLARGHVDWDTYLNTIFGHIPEWAADAGGLLMLSSANHLRSHDPKTSTNNTDATGLGRLYTAHNGGTDDPGAVAVPAGRNPARLRAASHPPESRGASLNDTTDTENQSNTERPTADRNPNPQHHTDEAVALLNIFRLTAISEGYVVRVAPGGRYSRPHQSVRCVPDDHEIEWYLSIGDPAGQPLNSNNDLATVTGPVVETPHTTTAELLVPSD